jgi:hypothetical protein
VKNGGLTQRQQSILRTCEREYGKIQADMSALGFVLQGSVTERWMECGNVTCQCHSDRKARHGPYCQWSWKAKGKTHSVYLTAEQAAICREWIGNHRRLEKLLKKLRALSLRAAAVYDIRQKP